MRAMAPLIEHVVTSVHGRILLAPPSDSDPAAGLIVGFHGYGEAADAELARLARIPGVERWTACAVQALHPFYTRTGQIVACWMTKQDRDLAIEDNVRYVDAVVARLGAGFAAARLVVTGFSQGASMAYRTALLGARPVDAVIAVGGDVPPELRTDRVRVPRYAMLARGRQDEWYTDEKLAADATFLRGRGADVRIVVHDGAHEWADEVCRAAGALLADLSSRAAEPTR
jgi:predicted esterase